MANNQYAKWQMSRKSFGSHQLWCEALSIYEPHSMFIHMNWIEQRTENREEKKEIKIKIKINVRSFERSERR